MSKKSCPRHSERRVRSAFTPHLELSRGVLSSERDRVTKHAVAILERFEPLVAVQHDPDAATPSRWIAASLLSQPSSSTAARNAKFTTRSVCIPRKYLVLLHIKSVDHLWMQQFHSFASQISCSAIRSPQANTSALQRFAVSDSCTCAPV